MTDEQDLGFSFRHTNGECLIFHKGKKATTLRGRRAVDFLSDVSGMSLAEQQQLMARTTGNYKRGNERTAKNHPRNRPRKLR